MLMGPALVLSLMLLCSGSSCPPLFLTGARADAAGVLPGSAKRHPVLMGRRIFQVHHAASVLHKKMVFFIVFKGKMGRIT